MLKRYEDFKKQNEGMKKFSKLSNGPSKGSKKNENKGKAPSPDYLDYEEEINKNILAKDEPRKERSGDQSNIKDTRRESPAKSKYVQPNDDSQYHDEDHEPSQGPANLNDKEDEKANEKKKVRLIGNVAKFPKDTKASKAYNFLENVKIPKNKIWYILIEKQNNELQAVKYATKKGVNLGSFVKELKEYYIKKHSGDEKTVEALSKIELKADGDGNFTSIANIPNIKVGGTKMVRIIAEDLTKLLSGKLDKGRRRR